MWKDYLIVHNRSYPDEEIQYFTRGKVVTSRWLDPSHGGLNLGFPTND